jgi:hypothetical protein
MLFDSRDSSLSDGPKRACVAALIVLDVCLGVESVPSKVSAQAVLSAFGSDNNALRLSAGRKTYRNETFRGHHLSIR